MGLRGAPPTPRPRVWLARFELAVGAALGGTAAGALAFVAMFGHHAGLGAFLFPAFGFAPIVAAALFGAWMGHGVVTFLLQEVRIARSQADAAARLAATPLRALAACGEGVVRVRGRVRSERPLYDLTGAPCVAIEMTPHGGPVAEPRHGVGSTFSLVEASGATVLIRAEHVMIAAGVLGPEETIVPVDGEVEVRGVARRRVDTSAATPYRATASAIEILGTVDEPVVIRLMLPALR